MSPLRITAIIGLVLGCLTIVIWLGLVSFTRNKMAMSAYTFMLFLGISLIVYPAMLMSVTTESFKQFDSVIEEDNEEMANVHDKVFSGELTYTDFPENKNEAPPHMQDKPNCKDSEGCKL